MSKLKVFGPPGFDFDKEFPPAPPNPLGENAMPITDDNGNEGFAELQGPDAWCSLYTVNGEWFVGTINPFMSGDHKEHKFPNEQEARDFIEQRKKLFKQVNNG